MILVISRHVCMQKGRVRYMKIEKVSDNQIRCTLTRDDLVSRDIKISELAYGTEKAKTLFRDMMRQANQDFGFEADDIPLMIEAVPLNSECIVLIITKVEDPEELDTRFSRFAPSVSEQEDRLLAQEQDDYEDALDALRRLQADAPASPDETADTSDASGPVSAVFRMRTLQTVLHACQVIAGGYGAESTLFKAKDDTYYLHLSTPQGADAAFKKACNILSEYGVLQKGASFSRGFLSEHFETLIAERAVQALGRS